MTQRSALCGFLASVLLLVPLTLSAAENDAPIADGPHAGAVDLLRGATLDDFDYFLLDGEQREKAFSLEDGVLSIAGTPFGWLGTKNDYHNFVVETEFRLLDPEGETNSGFLVRMGEQKPTTFLPHCVEIGIYEKETGTLFGLNTPVSPWEISDTYSELQMSAIPMNTPKIWFMDAVFFMGRVQSKLFLASCWRVEA